MSDSLPSILDGSILSLASSPNALTTLDAQKHMMKLRMTQQTSRFVALAEQEAQDEDAFQQLASSLLQTYRRESARSVSMLSQAKAFEEHLKQGEASKTEPERALKIERSLSHSYSGVQSGVSAHGSSFQDSYESLGEEDKRRVQELVEEAWTALETQLTHWTPSGQVIASVIEKKANSVYMTMEDGEGASDESEAKNGRRKKASSPANHTDLSAMAIEYKSKLEDVYERMKEWKRQTAVKESGKSQISGANKSLSSHAKHQRHASENLENANFRQGSTHLAPTNAMAAIHMEQIKEKVSTWISQHEQYVKSVRSVKEEMRTGTIPEAHASLAALQAQNATAAASSQLDLHLQSLLQSSSGEEDESFMKRGDQQKNMTAQTRVKSNNPSSNGLHGHQHSVHVASALIHPHLFTPSSTSERDTSLHFHQSSHLSASSQKQGAAWSHATNSASSRFSGGLIPPTPIRPQSAPKPQETPMTNQKRRIPSSTNRAGATGGHMSLPMTSAFSSPSSSSSASLSSSNASNYSLLLQTPSSRHMRHASDSFNANEWLQETQIDDADLFEDVTVGNTPTTHDELTMLRYASSPAMSESVGGRNRRHSVGPFSSSSPTNNSASVSLPDIRLASDYFDSPNTMRVNSPQVNGSVKSSLSPFTPSVGDINAPTTPSATAFIRLNTSHSGGSGSNGSVEGRSRSAGRISRASQSSTPSSSYQSSQHSSPFVGGASLTPSSARSSRHISLSPSPSPLSQVPFLSPHLNAASPASVAIDTDRQSLIMEELAEHIIDIMTDSRPSSQEESSSMDAKRRMEVEKYTKAILAIRSPSSSPSIVRTSSSSPAVQNQSATSLNGHSKTNQTSEVDRKRETRRIRRDISSSNAPSNASSRPSAALFNAFAVASDDRRDSLVDLPEMNLHLDQLISPSSSLALDDSHHSFTDDVYDELDELDALAGINASFGSESIDGSESNLSVASRRIESRKRAAMAVNDTEASSVIARERENAFAMALRGKKEVISDLDVSVSLLEAQLAQMEDCDDNEDIQQEDGDIEACIEDGSLVLNEGNFISSPSHSYTDELSTSFDHGAFEAIDQEYLADDALVDDGEELIEDEVDEELEAELARLSSAGGHGLYNDQEEDEYHDAQEEQDFNDADEDHNDLHNEDEICSVDTQVLDDDQDLNAQDFDDDHQQDIEQEDPLVAELEQAEEDENQSSFEETLSLHETASVGSHQLEDIGEELGLDASLPILSEDACVEEQEMDSENVLSFISSHSPLDDSTSSFGAISLDYKRRESVISDTSSDYSSPSSLEENFDGQRKTSISSSSSIASVSSLLQLRGGPKTNAKTAFSLEPLLFEYPTPTKQISQDISGLMPSSSSSSSATSPNSSIESPSSIDITQSPVNASSLAREEEEYSHASPASSDAHSTLSSSLTASQTRALLESPTSFGARSEDETKFKVSAKKFESSSSASIPASQASLPQLKVAKRGFTPFTLDSPPSASPVSHATVSSSTSDLDLLPISHGLLIDEDVPTMINMAPLELEAVNASFLDEEEEIDGIIVSNLSQSPSAIDTPDMPNFRLNLSINPDEDVNSSVSSSSPGFERIKKVLRFDA